MFCLRQTTLRWALVRAAIPAAEGRETSVGQHDVPLLLIEAPHLDTTDVDPILVKHLVIIHPQPMADGPDRLRWPMHGIIRHSKLCHQRNYWDSGKWADKRCSAIIRFLHQCLNKLLTMI